MHNKCDVCVNIYGKYYQTLATLKTLLKYNKEYIGKIYLIMEKKQPDVLNIDHLVKELNYADVEIFYPKFFFGFKKITQLQLSRKGIRRKSFKGFTKSTNTLLAAFVTPYRQAIRYQYAFEKSDKKYLLVLHNDVVFSKSFVGEMIALIDEGFLGVGQIGQCWNCPLHTANICNGSIVDTVHLSYKEVCGIISRTPSPRTGIRHIDKSNPLPMPECRLNEWVAMLNANEYKKITIPKGRITPFGKMGFDIATDFYRETKLAGYSYKNIDIASFSTHGYFSLGCGNAALFDNEKYQFEENAAKVFLDENFPVE